MVKEKVMKLLIESEIMVMRGVIALLTSVCAGAYVMQGLISSNDDIIVEKSSKRRRKRYC